MAEDPVDRAKRQTPEGCVRFWSVTNYGGPGADHWDYDPKSGYEDVPASMHDHAHSFYSKVRHDVNAINWNGREKETRTIHRGDHRWNWDFGRDLDAVEPKKE